MSDRLATIGQGQQIDQGNEFFEPPTSAYVHIPFCRRRCYYCDFPISVVGEARGENSGTIAQYVTLLGQEIKVTPIFDQPLATVFLGGGTPSLLSAAQLAEILTGLDQRIGIQTNAEISMEIDPGTFTLAQLQGYRQAGVNRLSVGAQAFDPDMLAACGRSHSVAQIYEAVEMVEQAGFDNFSLDLISGLPGQTLADWDFSLAAAIALAPRHLSVYDLTIEPGTVFERRYQPGSDPLPSDQATAQMYRCAAQTLTAAGYEHYEISNYAQPGHQCRHNRTYWQNRPYYGFGMGATSYTHYQRFSHPRKRREYFQWVQSLIESQGSIDAPQTSAKDRLLETLMLGLRLAEGLSLVALQQQFGSRAVERVYKCLESFQSKGWVDLQLDSPAARIRLTDPEGFLFSNQVLSALWQELD